MSTFTAPTEWVEPDLSFLNLKDAKEIAIDLETKDIHLLTTWTRSPLLGRWFYRRYFRRRR